MRGWRCSVRMPWPHCLRSTFMRNNLTFRKHTKEVDFGFHDYHLPGSSTLSLHAEQPLGWAHSSCQIALHSAVMSNVLSYAFRSKISALLGGRLPWRCGSPCPPYPPWPEMVRQPTCPMLRLQCPTWCWRWNCCNCWAVAPRPQTPQKTAKKLPKNSQSVSPSSTCFPKWSPQIDACLVEKCTKNTWVTSQSFQVGNCICHVSSSLENWLRRPHSRRREGCQVLVPQHLRE